MVILGVDTSNSIGTLVLSKESEFIGEVSLDMQKAHLRELLPTIDFLLKRTQLTVQNIDLFTVVVGPGSWSGIRIGVTTIKSLAHALDKPIIGVSSLDILAYNLRFTNHSVYPIIDASKEQVYYAGYHCSEAIPKRFTDHSLSKIEELVSKLKGPTILLGNGVSKYEQKIIAISRDDVFIAPHFLNHIRGVHIAEAGFYKFRQSGPDDTLSLAPIYLQKSEAEQKFERRDAFELGGE